jgi:vitamin B12 transporter
MQVRRLGRGDAAVDPEVRRPAEDQLRCFVEREASMNAIRIRTVFFLFWAAGLTARFAGAQVPPPVSEDVVVWGSLAPEHAPSISAASTVITRAEIERTGATDVLELLRAVPGVDLVQSGGPGKVASIFLRGTNSTQTLVLVDGVRLNRPDFAGYDFSALSTQDIERIEVVRGPFSSLYGSDPIGGVIAISTRNASREPAARATASGGNKGSHEETLFASAGAGDFGFSLSGREARDGGDVESIGGASVDHDAWRVRNGSARVDWSPSASFDLGVRFARDWAHTEIPFDGATPTPRRFTDLAQSVWTVPVKFTPSDSNTLVATLSQVEQHPTFSDPDGAFGYTHSDTFARTRAARVADTWTLPGQTLSAAAGYEASRVDLTDSFGPELTGQNIDSWGVGAEDQVSLAGGQWLAVAGIRYDHHSSFGSSTNPRLSLVWNLDSLTALRASYGTAFRAPSIGELYYPFSGNPSLDPERSRNFELGASRRAGAFGLDLSLFRNELRDLIEYDFVTNTNANVGRARTDGFEVSAQDALGRDLHARATYTYLRAIDESTGLALVRRPKHHASVEASWSPSAFLVTARVLYVGRRPDVDAVTFARVEDPSTIRLDALLRYRISGGLSTFLRVENLADRKYAEVNGFPAPRRRIALGLEGSL